MKFSILLPTRNRLELLKFAIESVRRQDCGDWELVVSDNASDEDVGAYIHTLGDPRIRVHRSERLIPVTDNWNLALEMSVGDYVIMLGDDDALLPSGLTTIKALIAKWRQPDAIYAQAMQYAYPGVIPGHPGALLQTGYNTFLDGRSNAFPLQRPTALEMVRAAMSFRILYGFNMQHFVVSRRLIDGLKGRGPFFQSPYPDYYAANAVLLTAKRLIATPQPFALIGISPKSFGFYYFNERENEGVAFLRNVVDADILDCLRGEFVPGSNMNDSWLCAMQTLARNFPDVVGSWVDFSRYRRLQYQELLRGGGRRAVLRVMRWREYPFYALATVTLALLKVMPGRAVACIRSKLIHRWFTSSPRFDPHRRSVPYCNILEAAAHANEG